MTLTVGRNPLLDFHNFYVSFVTYISGEGPSTGKLTLSPGFVWKGSFDLKSYEVLVFIHSFLFPKHQLSLGFGTLYGLR